MASVGKLDSFAATPSSMTGRGGRTPAQTAGQGWSYGASFNAALVEASIDRDSRETPKRDDRSAVPDIGDFKDIPVIEVFVKPGDSVKAEDPLVTLESDKATMDVPSPVAGVVKEVKVKAGDKVSEGSVVLTLDRPRRRQHPQPRPRPATSSRRKRERERLPAPAACLDHQRLRSREREGRCAGALRGSTPRSPPRTHRRRCASSRASSASILSKVTGTGPNGRILQEDVQAFVKGVDERAGGGRRRRAAAGLDLLPWPKVDFAKFGADRDRAAVAHQEDLRREPRAQLGDDPARHAVRRGRHHRARGAARHAQQGEREGGRQGHDARVPHQGVRRRA